MDEHRREESPDLMFEDHRRSEIRPPSNHLFSLRIHQRSASCGTMATNTPTQIATIAGVTMTRETTWAWRSNARISVWSARA